MASTAEPELGQAQPQLVFRFFHFFISIFMIAFKWHDTDFKISWLILKQGLQQGHSQIQYAQGFYKNSNYSIRILPQPKLLLLIL